MSTLSSRFSLLASSLLFSFAISAVIPPTSPVAAQEIVGKRPYEMDWGNRTQDFTTPLVDFENMVGWRTEVQNSAATFEPSREQQIWGRFVGKLTYRATGDAPRIVVRPPAPLPVPADADTQSCWIYGNNWSFAYDATTPPVAINALYLDRDGKEFEVNLSSVYWKEWFVPHRKFAAADRAHLRDGTKLNGFAITGGNNKEDRVIYLDNFAVFKEDLAPLTFKPRPKRGIAMFPGQGVGLNTGPGKLSFPNRVQTILPDNLANSYKTTLTKKGNFWTWTYNGTDGKLTYRLDARNGTPDGLSARWVDANGSTRLGEIRPCKDGGIRLTAPDGNEQGIAPDKIQVVSIKQAGDTIEAHCRAGIDNTVQDFLYVYRLWGKSLVIDVRAPGGKIAAVRYGSATGLGNAKLIQTPYYIYSEGTTRPAIAVAGTATRPLFLAANTDWYLSNASEVFATNENKDGRVAFNGGTIYRPRTDGKRNDCFERLFITLSPRYEEVLPNIPNPKSPWMTITGTHAWAPHGVSNRENDLQYWRRVRRYGISEMVVTDHETMWRDEGEGFTFRTRTAPGKGGDESARRYSRAMQDELGFVYGPYNNFTDIAAVNEYWTPDIVARTPENELRPTWPRCYNPKPSRAVEYCELLSPINEKKFGFSTAYCDVHTAVPPWRYTDYDARVPGAGTFAGTFYAYGEIMMLQKAAWGGPVYSEGRHHWLYSGLTDGNYGQDPDADLPNRPWLVDFDLRKMHPLNCNFGMGMLSMFYGSDSNPPSDSLERDAYYDRFTAATVAFGHTSYLHPMQGNPTYALRGYYMLQQLHSRYALGKVSSIRYVDGRGQLLDTSQAVATDAYKRSQLVTRYDNGCITVVNGSPRERLKVTVDNRKLDLPPNGWTGWTTDGTVTAFSGEQRGHRADYAATPKYLFVDSRGRFTRFAKAASNRPAICLILPDKKWEVIPVEGADCGFAIPAKSARALDEARKDLGPANLRVSRGLIYVEPVKGAFSYMLSAQAATPAAPTLTAARDEVVPGEQVIVQGKTQHQFQIPVTAKIGERIWQKFENQWIDFTVVPLAETNVTLQGDEVRVALKSNLAAPTQFTVSREGGASSSITLQPAGRGTVALDLGQPRQTGKEILRLEIAANGAKQTFESGLKTESGFTPVAPLPAEWSKGMQLRGAAPVDNFGSSGGYVTLQKFVVGGIEKEGIFMHPPYQGGQTGAALARYDNIRLPASPPATFRASVGKRDGSYLGDGILFKVVVIEPGGRETTVAERTVLQHEWQTLEADLAPWAGKTIGLKIVSDVGPKDDSTGDWACWAEMRVETREAKLMRSLDGDIRTYQSEAGPFPVADLTSADLRTAKSGWLHYEGLGLSGNVDPYATFAVINGVEIGKMATANGSELTNTWSDDVKIPLTPQAIATLQRNNHFALRNPGQDYFKVRRFWIELELADGRRASSWISPTPYTQPGSWPYAEGISLPMGKNIELDIVFETKD